MLFIIVIIIIIICRVIFNKQNLQSTVKKKCYLASSGIFQWRWSLEAEARFKGRFFLFTVVEICLFWHEHCAGDFC